MESIDITAAATTAVNCNTKTVRITDLITSARVVHFSILFLQITDNYDRYLQFISCIRVSICCANDENSKIKTSHIWEK